MKERPILFSGPMVRAIREGRKSVTRRIVKPRPVYVNRLGVSFWEKGPVDYRLCPYGQAGDRLWVRETWCCKMEGGSFVYNENGDYACHYKADGVCVEAVDDDGFKRYTRKGYEASPWRPSIFMPRWASRITLEIESVRVERLHEITASDAIAEGIRVQKGKGMIDGEDCYMMTTNSGYMRGPLGAIQAYKDLWQSINGPGSWAANPWVWVVQFKRVEAK